MRPETILKVTDVWLNCNVDRQVMMIRKYLDQLERGNNEKWEEFLIDEILDAQLSYRAGQFPD